MVGYTTLRRTRPLPAAIPLNPETMKAMVTGWFLAHSLGWLVFPPLEGRAVQALGNAGRETLAIKIVSSEHEDDEDPREAVLYSFPSTFLGGPATMTNLLGGVLQSLPIALLDLATGDEEGIKAYEQLAQFGYSGAGLQYPFLIALLGGYQPKGMPLTADFFTLADELARLGLMLEKITAVIESQEGIRPRRMNLSAEATLTVDRRWELSEITLRALRDLEIALRARMEELEKNPGAPM